MRNLLWTAMAVVVMLIGADNVLAQATTVVPANAGGNPPALKTNVKCTGTYNVPGGKVADYVTVHVYEKSIANKQVIYTLVDTINDPAPAGGNYTTETKAFNTGVEHKFEAYLYVKPAGGGASTLAPPGVVVNWTP
jgi:hypothetical protein